MGAASYGSVVTTIITYLQKIGINSSLDSLNLPPELKRIIGAVFAFYEELQNMIGGFPDFDLRSQLMVLSLALPFLLDVCLVWFINPIGFTLTHILDIIAFGFGTYFLTASIIDKWSVLNISIVCICAVFIILRIVFSCLTKEKGDVELYKLVQEICNYYMSSILPGVECDMTFRDLNKAIHKFSQIIEVVPPKANLLQTYIFLLVSFLLIFLAFWCIDAMPIPYDFPGIAKVIVPILAFPLGVLFFVIYILRLFHCGRVFITNAKAFLRRWGLRLLLMALDLLYIPILTCLIGMITPAKIGCPAGEYLYYQVKNLNDPIYPFVNHTAECRPCNEETELLSDKCIKMCSGAKTLRMKQSPDLLFVDDVIYMSGGIILYVFGAVMVGLPLLWFYIIRRNKRFINMINIYGDNSTKKWATIIHRMKTQGVFLFQDFTSRHAYWGVVLLGTKFILMVLSILIDEVWPILIVLMPVYFLVTFVLHVFYKPYIYRFNTIFESIMEFGNFLFALFSLIVYFGVDVPTEATLPVSIILLVFPLLSLIFIIFCEGKEGTKEDKTDPTILRKADTKAIKEREKMKKDGKTKNDIKKKKDGYQQIKDEKSNSHKGESIENTSTHSIPKYDSKRPMDLLDDNGKMIKNHLDPTDSESDSSSEAYSDEIQMFIPYTARASRHPDGHFTRPATPLQAVHGLKEHLLRRPHSTNNLLSDDSSSDGDDARSNATDYGHNNLFSRKPRHHHHHRKKRKHYHYHEYHDSDEEILPRKVEIDAKLIDSINGILEYEKEHLINPEESAAQIQAFTVKRRTMARRMTKMYKTLDAVLDGSTIEVLTRILNTAVLFGVVAFGWYLGALITKYGMEENFSCD